MVSVTVSETYDLSTKVNKMGIVGIHTPTGSLIDKMWPGLVLQHKKFRFVSCDVAMACASMLPADPLQIGVEAGAIAPQDMFNPILYRAVSNESMNNFQAYLASMAEVAGGAIVPAVNQGSVVDINSTDFKSGEFSLDQFSMYYGLLSDTSGWKKAMPQAGLTMRGLYPLVYQVVTPYGSQDSNGVADWAEVNDNPGGVAGSTNLWIGGTNGLGSVQAPDGTSGVSVSGITSSRMMFKGPSMRMPAIDTTIYSTSANKTGNIVPVGNGSSIASNVGHVPPAYVGLIVLRPAKLNQLYYRLKVTWTIEFTGLRSMCDIGQWDTVEAIGKLGYGTDYATQSTAMTSLNNMVDADDADVTKIMEGR